VALQGYLAHKKTYPPWLCSSPSACPCCSVNLATLYTNCSDRGEAAAAAALAELCTPCGILRALERAEPGLEAVELLWIYDGNQRNLKILKGPVADLHHSHSSAYMVHCMQVLEGGAFSYERYPCRLLDPQRMRALH